MNTQDIINYIIAHLPDHYVGEKRNPQNWVKSTSREVSSQGAIYLMECFQCMENFGLAPAGLIATVYLN